MSALIFGSIPANPQALTLVVRANATRKADLLAVLADKLRFPEWFGWNWDALNDMLGDLSWLQEEEVRILHEAVPDPLNETWSIYLSVLADAIDFRNGKPQRGFPDSPRLFVVLPSNATARFMRVR